MTGTTKYEDYDLVIIQPHNQEPVKTGGSRKINHEMQVPTHAQRIYDWFNYISGTCGCSNEKCYSKMQMFIHSKHKIPAAKKIQPVSYREFVYLRNTIFIDRVSLRRKHTVITAVT